MGMPSIFSGTIFTDFGFMQPTFSIKHYRDDVRFSSFTTEASRPMRKILVSKE
jgi:hypothetical protein